MSTDIIEIPRDWRQNWEQRGNEGAPFHLYVCDHDGKRVELLRDPASFSLTQRLNAAGTGSLTLPASHDRIPDLMAGGARWALRSPFTGLLATGILRGDQGQAHHDPTGAGEQIGTATWTLVDDLALLSDWLVFPPSGKAQETVSGPAESVARTLITRAASRLGAPVSFPVSQGRGADISVSARYQPLADILLSALTAAGISLRVTRDYAGMYMFSIYEPVVWPKSIWPHSGVVESWEWSRSFPGATRVHVLGPREGADRLIRTRTNTALEVELGTMREGIVDARDVPDVDPESTPERTLAMVHADMDSRGDVALDEAARTVGLRVSLSNTPELAYGQKDGLQLGDVLRTHLVPGRPTTAIPVTSAEITWTTEDGFTVRPVAGDYSETTNRSIIRRVNDLAIGYRRLKGTR